jgi:hypothetical protein
MRNGSPPKRPAHAPGRCQRQHLFGTVQTCAGRSGAAGLSPSRGRHQRPGKAGSAVAAGWALNARVIVQGAVLK